MGGTKTLACRSRDGYDVNAEVEREAQQCYWKEHSSVATVEAMMLDSQAADIDKMERPEVGAPSHNA